MANQVQPGTPRPLLIDLSHTAHTQARSGIQRVARELTFALQRNGLAVTVVWDRYAKIWRRLDRAEQETLAGRVNASRHVSRKSSWSAWQRWRGRLYRKGCSCMLQHLKLDGGYAGMLVPELFASHQDAWRWERAREQVRGRIVAVFHDAIALKFPEWTPAETVGRYPAYMQQLRAMDAIAAVSQASADDLRRFWELDPGPQPPVCAIPLAHGAWLSRAELEACIQQRQQHQRLQVLCVGTLEARKNHLALLAACEKLWQAGQAFDLVLVGSHHRATGAAAVREVERLQALGRPLQWLGSVSDAVLLDAYKRADLFAYPSLYEGFGLPVLEAKACALPCLTTLKGGLADAAAGGGCYPVEPDAESIAAGLETLFNEPQLRHQLALQALESPMRTWADYAEEVYDFSLTES